MDGSVNAGSVCAELENKGRVRFDYDLSVFGRPSSRYDHELARLACLLSTVGYDRVTEDPSAEPLTGAPYIQKGLWTVLEGLGFTAKEPRPRTGRDEQSYFFAFRPLTLGDREYDLFAAALIGSHCRQWYSDFDPLGLERDRDYAGTDEAGAIHLGFADAREFIRERLRGFILKHRTGRPVKLLLTGHSRGAAAAGLLAAKTIDAGGLCAEIPIDPEDLYVYCFAAPNYAETARADLLAERYRRIYTVVSPEDFVTEVFPAACGFGRYGTVYAIFGTDNRSRGDYAREKAVMTRFFSDYRESRPYVPYKDGSRSVGRVVSVLAQSMADMDVFYNKRMRLCFSRVTPFEYFRDTLCAFVGGDGTQQARENKDRATKLLLASALDPVGTCAAYRRISAFFVFKQGLAGVTGGKVGAEYFNDAHISETYLAYMMSMREVQLLRTQ